MRLQLAVGFACAVSLAACTSLPDVTASYRLPRADMVVTVTRTIGCNAPSPAGQQRPRVLYATSAVTSAVAYSADPARDARVPLSVAALDGPLSDGSLALDFYEDGRLKGVNSETAGQGSAVVQAIANLAPLLAASSEQVGPMGTPNAQPLIEAICRAFDRVSADGEPVSMIYEYAEDFAQRRPNQQPTVALAINCTPRQGDTPSNCVVAPPRLIPLVERMIPLVGHEASIRDLDRLLPRFCVNFGDPAAIDTVPAWDDADGGGMPLRLRRPVRYNVSVFQIPPSPDVPDADAKDRLCAGPPPRTVLWRGSATIPLTEPASLVEIGDTGRYSLPVPRGAPFGGNSFKLGLAESGAVTALAYGNTSGTAGIVGAVGTIGGALTDTDAERAARYQGEADMIFQQQRVIRCRQDATKC